jgi:hypothetical protein
VSSEDELDDEIGEARKKREKKQRAKVNKERRKGNGKRKKRQVRGCRAEFDYTGWSNYNIWRREVALSRKHHNSTSSSGSESEDSDFNPNIYGESEKDMYDDNCWTDCDFPSECHNSRLGRLRNERATAKASRHESLVLDLAEEWDSIKVELARKDQHQHHTEQTLSDSSSHNTFPTLDTSDNEVQAMVKLERKRQEGEPDMPSVGFSEEIDGLVDEGEEVEFEFVEKKRKKSVRKIQQLTGLIFGTDFDPPSITALGAGVSGENPPSSPLKHSYGVDDDGVPEKSFWIEDEDEDEDEDKDEVREGDKMEGVEMENGGGNRDPPEGSDYQMEELLRARSDFLNRFERGSVGEFGYEEEL